LRIIQEVILLLLQTAVPVHRHPAVQELPFPGQKGADDIIH